MKILFYFLILLCFINVSCSNSHVNVTHTNVTDKPIKLDSATTLSYFERNGFCTYSIYLLADKRFFLECGCEGRSHFSVGNWKKERDSMTLVGAPKNSVNVKNIDFKSFYADYPERQYINSNLTLKFKLIDSFLTNGADSLKLDKLK